MFLFDFILFVVSVQNLDNTELYNVNLFSSTFTMPPHHCTMNADMTSYTRLADQMVMLPTAKLPSAVEGTIVLSQTNITDSIDEGPENYTVYANMTSHDEFVDWIVMEPKAIVSLAVEPITVDLVSQTNITYGDDEDLEQHIIADNTTSNTKISEGMSMEPTDMVSIDVTAQTLIIVGTALKDLQLFSLPDLFDTVYFAVMFLMVSVYLYRRMKLSSLHRGLKNVAKRGLAVINLMGDIEKELDNQQSDSTRITFKNAKLNRKINNVSTELDDVKYDLERMYGDLNAWKQEWIQQSHRIRQVHPDYLQQLSEQPSSQVDRFIEQQERQMKDAACYFGRQFYHINQVLAHRHHNIMALLREIDGLHDVLNEQSASQF